jgi:hypothetical protein
MSKLSKSILDTIQNKKIIPHSKGYFIGLHTLLWVSFGWTLFVGVIAVSLLFLEIGMPERPYLQWMPLPGPLSILPYLPFLWGLGSLLCIAIAYCVFYKTDRWYRMPTLWIVWILIVGSLAGGYALHRTKMNDFWEKHMQKMIPSYRKMRADFRKWIPLPESGILPGKIQTIHNNNYSIKSPDNVIWNVILNCTTEECREQQKRLKLQQPMIFLGAIKWDKNERVFEATDINSPHKKRCKNKKDASCWRVLISPPKEKSNKKV